MFLGKSWKLRLSLFLDKMSLEIIADDHLEKKPFQTIKILIL